MEMRQLLDPGIFESRLEQKPCLVIFIHLHVKELRPTCANMKCVPVPWQCIEVRIIHVVVSDG
jgi:hypothetical protein